MSLQTDPFAAGTIALVALSVLAGMLVPLRYGMERLSGMARWLIAKLPYQPPPGMDAKEALEAASRRGEDSPGDSNLNDDEINSEVESEDKG